MPYRYRGRASVNPDYPQAQGTCDRCGIHYLLKNLIPQSQWAGINLIDQRIFVCETCLDVPQDQLRAIILPPDPVPVKNPRPDHLAYYNNTLLAEEGRIQGGNLIVEEDGNFIITETVSPIALLTVDD